MVDVLVHQDGPLIGSQPAEKSMWVIGAAGRAGGGELVDGGAQPLALLGQVTVADHHQHRDCGRVAAHRFVVSQRQWLDDAAENPDGEPGSRRLLLAGWQLKSQRAMRDRLSRTHLAPLPRALGRQPRHTLLQLFRTRLIKQVLHWSFSISQKFARVPRRPFFARMNTWSYKNIWIVKLPALIRRMSDNVYSVYSSCGRLSLSYFHVQERLTDACSEPRPFRGPRFPAAGAGATRLHHRDCRRGDRGVSAAASRRL